MRLILMMIVAIAALNIISGLVMLVKNKGRDIAILRTIGAGQGAILRIFFMAGAGDRGAGHAGRAGARRAVLRSTSTRSRTSWNGRPARQVFASDVYFLSKLPAKVDWLEVSDHRRLLAGLMSMVWTLPPAWRASRLDPVEALRYE